jgi:ribonuclease BN (tRNA processing enzyme)
MTVIGASGSYPGPESPASCYLLEAEHEGRTWRVLMDLGNGALGVLQRYVDPLSIDGVLISHLHADHCLDLCGYYVLRKYHPMGHQVRIPVWGPGDTPARMARAYDLEEDPGMTEEFDFKSFADSPGRPFTLGPFSITAREVLHPVTAYAIRVEADGRSLTYSGDTGACDALDLAARDADVFLSEASFIEGAPNPPDLHLTGREAGETATRAGARQLLLTHIPPWHDAEVPLAEAREVYAGPLELATPGKTYEI